jgi:succinate dehydrogenase / fumarate reductase cytochrome b subunit
MAGSSNERPVSAAALRASRPLSPHLQVYRFTITMQMSILHRITGAALYFGMIVPAVWLLAAAMGPAWYETVNGFFGSLLGRLILIGYSWALMHHMLGGIRHLIWDTGRGLDLVSIDRLAWATVVGSVGLTALLWLSAWGMGVL